MSDPEESFTGSFTFSTTALAIPDVGPSSEFLLTYSSGDPRLSRVGRGFTHSHAVRLVSPDPTSEDVVLVGRQGRSDRYTFAGGAFTPPLGVFTTLIRNAMAPMSSSTPTRPT